MRAKSITSCFPHEPSAILAYIRTATADSEGQSRRAQMQRHTLAVRAAALGASLRPSDMYVDIGASGAGAPHRRAGFRRLMAYCQAHRRPAHAPGLVLVTTLDRIGRARDPRSVVGSVIIVLDAFGWLVAAGECIISPKLGTLLGDPFDDAVTNMIRTVIAEGMHR